MRVAFRVDASSKTGHGHLMRCLTLAVKLREQGCEIIFFSRELNGYPFEKLYARGFVVRFLSLPESSGQSYSDDSASMLILWEKDAEAVIVELSSFPEKVDWLVVDHYRLDSRWECKVRPNVGHLMVIDDLANRKHSCDLLLDQTFGEGRERYADCLTQPCERLFGSRYALLRPEFLQYRKEDDVFPDNDSLAVHLFFGSGDQGDFALRFSKLLLKYFPEIKLNVVARTVSDRCEKVWGQVREDYPGRFRVVKNPDSMAKTMSECDVAIGAPGIATWERACVGIPAAYLATAENQVEILRGLESSGLCVFIGRVREISDEGFINAVRLFFEGKDKLISMRTRGIHMFDGKGTDRVAEKMVSM